MNVETITMDPDEARERLKAYRTSLHRSADVEYEAAAAGYQALAEGTPIIQYERAIRDAPRDDKSRPMLAIARADRTQVRLRWERREALFDTSLRDAPNVPTGSLLRRSVDMGEPPDYRTEWGSQHTAGHALVPMVPPHALKAAGGRSRLSEHLILWEVEEWSDTPIGAVPDRDPYLLRPIHGDLCAVVAEWDLTPLERAVRADRASR
jgi:hypothetical protein